MKCEINCFFVGSAPTSLYILIKLRVDVNRGAKIIAEKGDAFLGALKKEKGARLRILNSKTALDRIAFFL